MSPGEPTRAHHLDRARLRVAAGADVGDVAALGDHAETLVRVAVASGAPVLAALDVAAEAEEDGRRAARAVHVASAQGRAVTVGLLLAPVLLVPLAARILGIDLVAYHRTPLGSLTGGLGLLLLVTGALAARRAVATVGAPARPAAPGRRWVVAGGASLVAAFAVHPLVAPVVGAVLAWRLRPSSPPVDPRIADAADLMGAAVAGGVPVSEALRLAADEVADLAPALRRLAFDLEHGHAPGDLPPGVDRLADVLTDADRLGAPVGPTLRRLAATVRADELARVLAAAERLPVRLTFPTALCLLPGTLLLVGAPIVHAGLDGAFGT